jgi:hypothetical protein
MRSRVGVARVVIKTFYYSWLRNETLNSDPEYIVRLVGQVVRVSLETVKIVNALPEHFADIATK